MTAEASDRVGLMVIRAMRVDGRFRARMTSSPDIQTGDEVVAHSGDRDAVLDAVGGWLDEFLATTDP